MRLSLIAIGFAASIERVAAQSEVLEDQLDQLAGANSAGAHWPHVQTLGWDNDPQPCQHLQIEGYLGKSSFHATNSNAI